MTKPRAEVGTCEPSSRGYAPLVAIRPIARLGEPLLRRASEPIAPARLDTDWFRSLIRDMVETMHAASGAGLAAPQIFEPFRVCVIEVTKNDRYPSFPPIPLTVLVNPELEPVRGAGSVALYEGCLSVPGLRGRVVRPRAVHLKAWSDRGERMERTIIGVEAAILQHEVDHLDGKLFVDRADPATLTFMDEYERHVPLDERVRDPFPT